MLYDKLKNYLKNGIYPFHMPGHKRNFADDIIPYNIDLTEIAGFDNLHGAEGCIKEIADKAKVLYNTSNAYLLINGATGGILSAIRSLTVAGDKVIVARNCHKSVYNAIELCNLDTEYIMPEFDDEFSIFSSVNPSDVEQMLLKNAETKLVIITSPTYEGVVSDIKSISEICHKYGAKLFVDEAHGAHFPFQSSFPAEAVQSGADVAVVSLHKTLPSLTQTALLLTNDNSLCERIEANLSVFESSSPSYILMASIEKCFDYITNNSKAFDEYTNRLNIFREQCKSLENIKVLSSANDFAKHNYYDFDISKIIVSVRNTDITGVQLAEILRNKYNIETEMAYSDYVLAMTSVCDTSKGFEMLEYALHNIDKTIKKLDIKSEVFSPTLPDKSFITSNNNSKEEIIIPFNESDGRISLEYIWAYPPGIPIITPGEIIDKAIINYVLGLNDSGVNIYSTNKNAPEYIKVAQTD